MSSANTASVERATAFIDTAALRHNALLAKKIAPHSQLLCIVKANAYGHGAEPVALALGDIADGFGVARIDEGQALRDAGIDKPVVVMAEHLNEDNLQKMLDSALTPVLYSDLTLQQCLSFCEAKQFNYWLKLDTGMARLGLRSTSFDAQTDLQRGNSLKEIAERARHCKAVMTHFHSADNPDLSTTADQLALFSQLTKTCFDQPGVSFSNSAALLNHTGHSYTDWLKQVSNLPDNYREYIRPGLMLYGIDPLSISTSLSRQLKPVMRFCAPVIDIRQLQAGESVGYGQRWVAERRSVIATVAAGYGDGYPRHAPDGTPILINGQRGKLTGTVSMDMIGIDITDIVDGGVPVKPGDTADLWGHQLPVNDIATRAQTISYQLLTGIAPRVPRIYY